MGVWHLNKIRSSIISFNDLSVVEVVYVVWDSKHSDVAWGRGLFY
jgi:hypothetical protein